MKKFIIAMVAVVLGFSSCSKEAMLLGSWELESIKMQGVTINVSEADMNITLTFKEGYCRNFCGCKVRLFNQGR